MSRGRLQATRCRTHVRSARLGRLSIAACWVMLAMSAPLGAQTVEGRLLDLESGMPIPLGLVVMFTEAGDSVTFTVADEVGRFSVSAAEPGSFLLNAAALGYEETPAGVFELGEGGVVTVEYRLRPEPIAIDEMIVSLDQRVRMHHLVRNGFVRRLQRGIGEFITPYEIEHSPARSTEQLMAAVPGVRIGAVYEDVGGGVVIPREDIGETVQVRRLDGGWCSPTIYVDGRRVDYDPGMGLTLSMMADRSSVEGIEIYRRPAEIPVEYNARPGLICGVLVVWTKSGLAPGQRPSMRSAGDVAVAQGGGLPPVDDHGPPPEPGERIRVALSPEVSESLALSTAWGGTFVTQTDSTLVATDPELGRAVAMPVDGVLGLQVLRERPARYAWMRGAMVGAAVGGGTWLGLSGLCEWSDCGNGTINAWLPSAAVGLFVAFVVQRLGPGNHWIESSLRRP